MWVRIPPSAPKLPWKFCPERAQRAEGTRQENSPRNLHSGTRVMLIDDIQLDRHIEDFLRTGNETEASLFNFFEEHVLHPDHEVEFTHCVAKNIIKIVHPLYTSLPRKKRFHLLKAIAKLFDVCLAMKAWEFQLSRDDAAWFWNGYPLFFSSLASLTYPLEVMRHEIGQVGKGRISHRILLVEGPSEENFVRALQLLTRFGSLDFPIFAYRGKDQIQNLIHFIREKNRQGVLVYLTFDKDRQSDAFLRRITRSCKVEKRFGFKRDFESSFDPAMIADASNIYIRRYTKQKLTLTTGDIQVLLAENKPFSKSLEERFSVSIKKPIFGGILGELIAAVLNNHWNEIMNKRRTKRMFRYEIYTFLNFLVKY